MARRANLHFRNGEIISVQVDCDVESDWPKTYDYIVPLATETLGKDAPARRHRFTFAGASGTVAAYRECSNQPAEQRTSILSGVTLICGYCEAQRTDGSDLIDDLTDQLRTHMGQPIFEPFTEVSSHYGR